MDEQGNSYSNSQAYLNFMGDSELKQQSDQQQQDSEYMIKKINIKQLPQTLQQVWKRRSAIDERYLTKTITLPALHKSNSNNGKTVAKSVCAKILKHGQLIVQCFNCRTDKSCVICMDCFKSGNHEGHKYVIRAASGGCCDCGDKQAWKVEGFCSKHDGKFNDSQIEIAPKIYKEVKQKISGLLYLYFYINIKKLKDRERYNYALITYLRLLNTNNLHYNKITSLILCSALASQYQLCQALGKRTILQNILTFAISQQYIKQWLDVFICMFPYYTFKLQLLKCYIQNYGRLIDGSEESFSCGGSISCQLLSSYQLIEKYCDNYQVGLGQHSSIPRLTKIEQAKPFRRYYIRLYYDLNYFNKLIGGTSLKYWKMHINSKQSISNLFMYYEHILKFYTTLLETQAGMTQKQITINIIQMVSIQQQAVCIFIALMRIIKSDKQLLHKVMAFLWNKCAQYIEQNHHVLYFFRIYQRCLGLALFTYFDYKILNNTHNNNDNTNNDSISNKNKELINNLCTVLKVSKQQCSLVVGNALQKIITTYMVYPQSIAQPGFGQSIYVFLYFYKVKFATLSTVDMLAIKLFMLLQQNLCKPHSQFTDADVFGLANLSTHVQQQQKQGGEKYMKQLKKKKVHFSSILNFTRYLYTTSLPEINIAYEIDKANNAHHKYQQQYDQILQRLFYEHKGTISIQKLNAISTKLFVKQNQHIKEWVKQNCTQNKQKKQFVYSKYKQQLNSTNGINLTDIWENSLLQQNIKHSDPFKTKQVIKGSNIVIFQQIWSIQNIIKLVQITQQLYGKHNEGIQTVLQNILHIYLLKEDKVQAKMIKQQILNKYVQRIPVQIRRQLNQFSTEMVEEGQDKQVQKERRKSKFEELKMKKLQKFKHNQNKILNSMNQAEQQIAIPQLYSRRSSKQCVKQDSHNSQQQEHAPVCCICRNNDESKLVYLVSIEPRNQQKLLKLGPGLNCYAFYSCYHTFDYECIKHRYSNIAIMNNNQIKCPLCKSAASILLPLHPQAQTEKVNEVVLNKIFAILLMNTTSAQYVSQSVYEQIIKSIYHFAISVLVQPKLLFKSRAHVYQNLIKIMMQLIKHQEIQQIKVKLQGPNKIYQQVKVTQNKKLGNSKKVQTLKHKKIIKQTVLPSKVKSKKVQISAKQEQNINKKQEEIKQHFPLYSILLKNIIQKLQNNKNKQQKTIEQQLRQIANTNEYSQFANILCKVLFEQEVQQEQKKYILNKKPLQFRNILQKLPQKYAAIGPNSKCSQCKQLGANMIKCLLCEWSGCQKCQLGKSENHVQLYHGGIGVFMLAQSSIVFYQSMMGISVVGPIYENQWGHTLTKTQKWEEFQLNVNRIRNIQNTLFYDKPITYVQK